MQTSATDFPSIFYGVNFLLQHLAKPDFPRTIATKRTDGKQIIVGSKEEAIAFYKEANYMDCRFAAYPYNVNNSVPQIIDFVMLDLDLNNFRFSRQKLDRTLNKILISLKKQDIEPTVMWTGNGYHVLVPIEPLQSTLEGMVEFANFEGPSKSVLRFLEKYLSNSKSDSIHNSTVSFGNCMLRVPGSFNSKHNNDKKNQVLIVKKWNNQRLSIKPLLGDFLAYLLDKKDEKKSTHVKYYNNNLLSKI